VFRSKFLSYEEKDDDPHVNYYLFIYYINIISFSPYLKPTCLFSKLKYYLAESDMGQFFVTQPEHDWARQRKRYEFRKEWIFELSIDNHTQQQLATKRDLIHRSKTIIT
jgi:hypothetical protein